jgi:ABC-type branched-subunit amino acid transport system ATPase component
MKILEVKNLKKEFDGVKAVDDLSFVINKGTITSLIGPNGAGKTTVFNILCGLCPPDSGTAYLDGKQITNLPTHRIAKAGLGRTFQNIRIFLQITALENLMLATTTPAGESLFGALGQTGKVRQEEKKSEKQALKYLDFVGLTEKKDKLAENLSYGQRRLLELARALATGAQLLLLDESTTGVYPETRIKILKLLRELRDKGKTILFIEHNMKTVMGISETVIVMNYGKKLAEGSPDEIRKNEQVIEAYLGRDDGSA